MSPRKRHLPFVAVVAAAGALAIGGQAQSQTPATASIVANDFAFKTEAGGAPNVTIAAGGKVVFSHPSEAFAHRIAFPLAQPSGCIQTIGTPSGTVPPLPNQAASAAWAGECTFATPGTYAFVCTEHSSMTGSITVVAPPPPPPPPGAPPPPAAPPPPPPPPSSSATAAFDLRVTMRQRGTVVRGSVSVRRAGSRLLARAFARRGALSGGSSRTEVRVARQSRSSVGPGRVSFGLGLNAAARRALRRSGRLAITVRVTVTPASGAPYTAKRTVVVRPR